LGCILNEAGKWLQAISIRDAAVGVTASGAGGELNLKRHQWGLALIAGILSPCINTCLPGLANKGDYGGRCGLCQCVGVSLYKEVQWQG
jgi:hypothetical protein